MDRPRVMQIHTSQSSFHANPLLPPESAADTSQVCASKLLQKVSAKFIRSLGPSPNNSAPTTRAFLPMCSTPVQSIISTQLRRAVHARDVLDRWHRKALHVPAHARPCPPCVEDSTSADSNGSTNPARSKAAPLNPASVVATPSRTPCSESPV